MAEKKIGEYDLMEDSHYDEMVLTRGVFSV